MNQITAIVCTSREFRLRVGPPLWWIQGRIARRNEEREERKRLRRLHRDLPSDADIATTSNSSEESWP